MRVTKYEREDRKGYDKNHAKNYLFHNESSVGSSDPNHITAPQFPNSRRSSHTASGRAGWTQIAIPRCRVWTRGLRGGAAKALRRARRACSGMSAYEKALLWCVRPEVAGQSLMRATRIGLWCFAELQLHGLAGSESSEAFDH